MPLLTTVNIGIIGVSAIAIFSCPGAGRFVTTALVALGSLAQEVPRVVPLLSDIVVT